MSQRVEYLTRQERAASTFDGTYQTLGDPLEFPAVLIKVINNSNQDIDVSIDGVTDHDFVPASSFFLYDLRANHGVLSEFVFIQGTQFYINGTMDAGNTGDVYLIVLREGQ